MFVIEDVRTSLEATAIVADKIRTSIGKTHITIKTNRGSIEVKFDRLATDFMAIGTSREGLHVVALLADNEVSRSAGSTIILSKIRKKQQ